MMTDLPMIPENITIHLGPPDAPAENVTVNFSDYIKNVASSGLYPTWPENALRANIYAQISLALNRIYNKHYRDRGYDFDITNSPEYDQKYVHGRDIFLNISQIVDEIFDEYVARQGNAEPLFTQYCNGTTDSCGGLSRWGSVFLARDGYTPYEILQNYYGGDIDIITDAPVMGAGDKVPNRVLRSGMSGSDVRQVQLWLNSISQSYPAIPKIYPTNGVYDEATEDAVKEFQRIFLLDDDGIVGRMTWYKLLFVYNNAKRLSELYSGGLSPDKTSWQLQKTLVEGDTGYTVKLVQNMLNYIAMYDYSVPSVKVDGYFGPLTRAAVVAFQKAYGLTPDGIVGEITFYKMYDVYRGILNSQPENLTMWESVPYPGHELTIGQQGENVRELQEYLNYIAESDMSLPAVPVTGIYGERTRAAVDGFQRSNGLDTSNSRGGVVNAETWEAITSLYRELHASRQVNEGQYPGQKIS